MLAIANGPVLIGKYKFFSVPDTPGGLRQPSVGFPAALLPNTTGVAGLAYPYAYPYKYVSSVAITLSWRVLS
jgi:hypothetical protein